MNIAFIWNFSPAKVILPKWRDGLRTAVEIIGKDHKVDWFLGDDRVPEGYDFLLFWTSSNDSYVSNFLDYPARKGLCLTTDLGVDIENLRKYDVVFAEAQPVFDVIRTQGLHVIKAFGTDTDFYELQGKDKIYKHFYPATFSPWKRQNLFADKYGKDGLCLGTIQPDGWPIYHYCVEKGTDIITGYLPSEMSRDLYDMSEHVDITGWEGSGRTVIEAMSMNLPVTVADDNYKCQSYVKELKESGLKPRDFVIKNYSAYKYAKDLLRGIVE